MMQGKKIEQFLVGKNILSQNQLAWAISRKEITNEKLVNILVAESVVDPDVLGRAWAELYGLEFIDLSKVVIPDEVLARVPENIIKAYQFVPTGLSGGSLEIAIADPSDTFSIESIKMVTGMPCRIRVASRRAIEKKMMDIQDSRVSGFARTTRLSNVSLETLIEDVNVEFIEEDERKEIDLDLAVSEQDHTPVITLVNKIILDAVKLRASDIHIDASDRGLIVKYRIDGTLYEKMHLEKKAHNAVISRIKVIACVDITEKSMPQDGSFKMKVEDSSIDFRISILPSYFGQNVVIRVLNRKTIPLVLDSLGFNKEMVDRFKRVIRRPSGLVLVTGPTGSGKTTTLYSALSHLDVKARKVVTIENPIEYQISGVHQIQVNINPLDESRSLTFAKGLRSILRHDPDVIMVGEIRDSETADIAIQAASTGHMVLTTIHANTALDVVGRFLSLGVDRYLFTNSLSVIVAQRLVRIICPYCKAEVIMTDDEAYQAGIDLTRLKSRRVFKGRGCVNCSGTGYLGRSAICEYIEVDDDIRQLIDEKSSFVKIRRAAVEKGMKTLRDACIEKVLRGHTTIEEFIFTIGDVIL